MFFDLSNKSEISDTTDINRMERSCQARDRVVRKASEEGVEKSPCPQKNGAPWFPRTIPAYAKASVGDPQLNEIYRSMPDRSMKGFVSRATHSSTAKAVVSCVGG